MEDSIKFSINESKVLVDAWQTLPGILHINDSLKEANTILQFDLKQCESLKNDYKQQNKNYQSYSETISKEIDKQDTEMKKLKFWKKFWKTSTGTVAAFLGSVIIYEEIKNN